MPKKTRTRSLETASARKSVGFGAMSGTAVLEQAPEIENAVDSPAFNMALPQLQGISAPPPLQRSVDMLGKAPNSAVRQQIMRTLQKQYGNSYAQSVARYNNVSHVQVSRQPAPATQTTPAKPTNGQPVTKKTVVVKPTNGQPVTKKTVVVKPATANSTSKQPANTTSGTKKPATKPAAKKPATQPTNTQAVPQQPLPTVTGEIAASDKIGGKATVLAYGKPITIAPKQVGTPQSDLGFGGSNSGTLDVKPNNTWEQNSATANERGNGTRTTQQNQRNDGTYDIDSNSSQTDGDWEREATSNTDKLGVNTDTANSQTGSGSQSHKTETYTQPGSTQTRTVKQTDNDGTWITNEKKTATYSDLSAEKNRDKREHEQTTTESSGKGKRTQTGDSTENKTVVPNSKITTTKTVTNTGDRVDGERNIRETKVTQFGPGNKDKKVSETAIKGSSSTGVRNVTESSTENKTENDDFTGNSVKNTNRTGNINGNWQDLDEKATEYSDRRESISTTISGTGTRNQTENIDDTKTVVIGQKQVPVTTGTKITNRTDSINGTWGEKTRKEKQQGITVPLTQKKISNFDETSVTSVSGTGKRSEVGYEKATDYVDKKGRERSKSYLTNEKRIGINSSETTTTTTSTSDGVSWNGTAKVTYNRGGQYNKERLFTLNKPKDQSAPPANPKMQEAVLWNHNFGGFNGAKQNAIDAGTYSKQGDVEQYTYKGQFEQTASNATVTTGSASYAGSKTLGYAIDGRQYNRTDKGKVGALDYRNDVSAGSLVGATSTLGGGATFNWNGDPTLTAKLNASGFVGAKANVSNTTAATLGAVSANATLTGEALVGGTADARAELGVSTKGLLAQGEASAFAGAKVTGTAQGGVGLFGVDLITAKGTAEASAGLGAGAKGTFNVDWRTGTVTIGGGLSATVGLGAGASGETTIFFGKAAQQAKKGANKAVQQAKRGIGTAKQRASNFVGAVKQRASNFVGAARQKAKNFVGAAKQKTSQFIGAAKQKSKNFIGAAKQKAKSFVGAAKQKAKNFVAAAKQKVSNGIRVARQKIGNTVKAVRQKVTNTVKAVRQKVANKVRAVKQKVKSFVGAAKQKAKNFVAAAKRKITSTVSATKQKVKSFVGAAKQKAKSFVAAAKQKAKNFLGAAKQKATNVVRAAKQKATNVVRAAKQNAGNALASAKRKIANFFGFGRKP